VRFFDALGFCRSFAPFDALVQLKTRRLYTGPKRRRSASALLVLLPKAACAVHRVKVILLPKRACPFQLEKL
jgi:hypothetical protein